jgi:hypothetical protein
MIARRLTVLSSAVLALGTISLVAPRAATAASRSPLICGPVCVQTCLDGQFACDPCVWDGTCYSDPQCAYPFGSYVAVGCGPGPT